MNLKPYNLYMTGLYHLKKRWKQLTCPGVFKDDVHVQGRLEIWERPADSDKAWSTSKKIVDEPNLVVDVGLNKLRDIYQGDSNTSLNTFLYGTDGTNAAAGDTGLGTQVHSEVFDSYSDQGTGKSRDEGLLDSIEPSSQPHDMAEFGTAFADGTLWSRVTFPAETKDSSVEWRVRYTMTLQNV